MERSATFDFSILYRFVWWSTVAVIVFGIAREVFVAFYGVETPLRALRLISLDDKHSLQAWQQSSLGLVGALAALALAASESVATGLRRYWIALVFVGLYISFDEQVGFHPVLVPLLHAMHLTALEGGSAWVIIGIPVALAVGAFFIPFFWKVPPRFAAAFFLSGFLFAGSAIGLEILGGSYVHTTLPYMLETVAEESLESVGLAVFAMTILEYWRLHRQDIRISVIRR